MKYTFTFDVIAYGSYVTTVNADDEDTALDLAMDNYNCADWDDFDIEDEQVIDINKEMI